MTACNKQFWQLVNQVAQFLRVAQLVYDAVTPKGARQAYLVMIAKVAKVAQVARLALMASITQPAGITQAAVIAKVARIA